MEKRIILAFVLSFIALYAFRTLFLAPAASEQSTSVDTSAKQPPVSPAAAEKAPPVTTSPKQEIEDGGTLPESVEAEKIEEVAFDTPLYSTTFSNAGASLKSFRLKEYSDGNGNPLELINQEASSKVGWPLALTTGDKGIDEQLQNAKY